MDVALNDEKKTKNKISFLSIIIIKIFLVLKTKDKLILNKTDDKRMNLTGYTNFYF